METDQIERLLAHDPLMCHYTVTAKDELPEIVETYPFALVSVLAYTDCRVFAWQNV